MNIAKLKNDISNMPLNVTVGFLYWVQEHKNLRGLQDIRITEYPDQLKKLLTEYNNKYPNGLTGWSN